MIFSEVVDFIKENKRFFDKFEEDLGLVTKNNLRIAEHHKNLKKADVVSIQVENMTIKPMFPDSSGNNWKRKYDIEFKGKKHLKDLGDIFFDFALNHYKKVSSGERFTLCEGSATQQFDNLNLDSELDKKIYLASMFSLFYNLDFIRSVDIASFESFLYSKEAFVFAVQKEDMADLMTAKVDVISSGLSRYFSGDLPFSKLKSETYLHAGQMFSNLGKYRNQVDLVTLSEKERKKTYEALRESLGFEDVLPAKTREKLDNLIGRHQKSVKTFGVDDDFKMEAILYQMPDRISKDFYQSFRDEIMFSKENGDMKLQELDFSVGWLLTKKYGYKNLEKYKYIERKQVNALFEVEFDKDRHYKKLGKLDLDFKIAYASKHFEEESSLVLGLLAPLYIFSLIFKMPPKDLDSFINGTKESYRKFLDIVVDPRDSKDSIAELYSKKSVLDGTLFTEMKRVLDLYCYYINSSKYMPFPEEIKKSIASEGLKYHVLLKSECMTGKRERLGVGDGFEGIKKGITKDIFEVFGVGD